MTMTTLTASILLPEDIELELERLEGLKLDPPLTARQKIRDMVEVIMSDSEHPFASHQILHHINEYLSKTYGNGVGGDDEYEYDTLLLAAYRAG